MFVHLSQDLTKECLGFLECSDICSLSSVCPKVRQALIRDDLYTPRQYQRILGACRSNSRPIVRGIFVQIKSVHRFNDIFLDIFHQYPPRNISVILQCVCAAREYQAALWLTKYLEIATPLPDRPTLSLHGDLQWDFIMNAVIHWTLDVCNFQRITIQSLPVLKHNSYPLPGSARIFLKKLLKQLPEELCLKGAPSTGVRAYSENTLDALPPLNVLYEINSVRVEKHFSSSTIALGMSLRAGQGTLLRLELCHYHFDILTPLSRDVGGLASFLENATHLKVIVLRYITFLHGDDLVFIARAMVKSPGLKRALLHHLKSSTAPTTDPVDILLHSTTKWDNLRISGLDTWEHLDRPVHRSPGRCVSQSLKSLVDAKHVLCQHPRDSTLEPHLHHKDCVVRSYE